MPPMYTQGIPPVYTLLYYPGYTAHTLSVRPLGANRVYSGGEQSPGLKRGITHG